MVFEILPLAVSVGFGSACRGFPLFPFPWGCAEEDFLIDVRVTFLICFGAFARANEEGNRLAGCPLRTEPLSFH